MTIRIGTTDEMFGLETLRHINIPGRPTVMPTVNEGESVVCLFDRFIHVVVFVCETLEDMQGLYDQMYMGLGKNVSWRAGIVAAVQIVDMSEKSNPPNDLVDQ